MVRKRSLSNSSHSTYNESVCDEEQDTISDAPSAEIISECNTATLTDSIHEEKLTFGNIKVKNSTDIQFGNKTCYLGPVTIKQILCAHENENKKSIRFFDSVPNISSSNNDNLGYIPDNNVRDIILDNKIITAIGDEQHQRASVIKGVRRLQTFSQQYKMLFLSLLAVLLISVITLMVVFLTRNPHVNAQVPKLNSDSDEQDKGTPVQYPEDASTNSFEKLYIIPREKWSAKMPKAKPTALRLPVPYVIIMHTATEFCVNVETCIFHVKIIQDFHVNSRGWDDIGYNFLVGGDGRAYEGRGWNSVGAQVYGYNDKCIGIAFIGTFNKILPPHKQIITAKKLIEMGLNNSIISHDYKLFAARQLQSTQSPGEVLYENVKSWDHWSSNP